jgi:hypothetical protein
MLSRLFPLLFLVSSCGLFKAHPSLSGKSIPELLTKVKSTGEGKGRLTAQGKQNLFGIESALKPNSDWMLAVSIPLHGEEVMVVPNLKSQKSRMMIAEGFDQRLMQTLTQELGSEDLAEEYMHSLRSLLRFLNARELGLPMQCKSGKDEARCTQDGEEYFLKIVKDTLQIQKDKRITVVARNLTDSFFEQTIFTLQSAQKDLLTLELFWTE